MASSKISNNNPSFWQIPLFTTKSDIEGYLLSIINGLNVTFGIAVINNLSKDDVITNLTNTPNGLLIVYESASMWQNHPAFCFIKPEGDVWSGTLAYSSGTFSVTTYRHLTN